MISPPSSATGTAADGHPVGRGVASLLSGRFLALALSFLAVTLLARSLGPASMGVLQFALAVFFYLGFLNDLGLTVTGVRDLSRRERPAQMIGETLGARLILTAAALSITGLSLLLIPVDQEGLLIGIVLATGLIASSLSVTWVLQARERFRALAAIEVAAALAQVLAAAFLVNGRPDVAWGALAVVMGSWTSVVLSWILVGRERAMLPKFSPRIPAMVLRAMPLGIAAIAIAVYYTIDTILLGLMRTSSEVGYYAVAYRLVLPVLTVAVVTGNIALPVMSRLLSSDRERLPSLLSGLSRGLLLLGLPVAAGTSLVAVPLMTAIFGDAYAPAAVPLTVLIWSCVTVFANAPFGFLMVARGQDRQYMRATVIGALLNVVANLLLIPAFGMLGAAAATILAELVVLAVIVWETRDVSLRPLVSAVTAALPPTALMAIVILPWRDSLAAIPIGVATYAGAAVLTGAVPRNALPTRFPGVWRAPARSDRSSR